jgi:ATP-dependent Clp protease protease subunit
MAQRPNAGGGRLFCGPVLPFRRKTGAPAGYRLEKRSDDEADLYVYDVVGDSWDGVTAKMFADDMKRVASAKTLRIYINSPGGSVFDGVSIHNQLRRHKARKIVQIDGIAASIASVIAMAGDEIVAAPGSFVMIHNPWGLAIGEAADLRKVADSLDKVRGSIINVYTARTGQDAEKVAAMMDEETWMTAQEAVDLGFADRVSEDQAQLAALSRFDLSAFAHVPEPVKAAAEQPPPADAADADEGTRDAPPAGKVHPKILAARAELARRGIRKRA